MECKNCSSTLRDDHGFCSYCGSRVITERISFKFLWSEFLDKVLSVDNRLLKTFLHLFSKPELVIDDYIKGVRKKYFNPLSYLLISITLGGIYIYFLKEVAMESLSTSTSTSSTNPLSNKEFGTNFINLLSDYQAFFSALNIPIYGFISWIIFLNRKKYNFYEHLVIFLYASAQITIVTFFLTVPTYYIDKQTSGIISLVMAGVSFLYFGYVLIRLFKLTFVQFIIKTLYFLVVGTFIFMLVGILMNVAMFLFMREEYIKQFLPHRVKDSIQNVQPIDSLRLQKNDSIKKEDPKAISFYEASSKLNCLS